MKIKENQRPFVFYATIIFLLIAFYGCTIVKYTRDDHDAEVFIKKQFIMQDTTETIKILEKHN